MVRVLKHVFGFVCIVPLWELGAAAQPGVDGSYAAVEQVEVTARRRTEKLQDTPTAVTVLSADALEKQQVTMTTELDRSVPNLQFTSYSTLTGNNAAAQVFIRGIGQTDATSAIDPGVGLYIDDVYMGRSVGGAMELGDVANVQVLRGPHGTLFGRNTIGGAILITTNAPGEDIGGTLRFGLGSYALKEGVIASDIPLPGDFSARASFGVRVRDGYVKRVADGVDLGNQNTYSGQAALRWRPLQDVDLILRADYTNADENGSPFVFRAINPRQAFVAYASVTAGCPGATFPPAYVPDTADPRCGNAAQYLGPYRNGGTYPAKSTLENYGASLMVHWTVNDWLTLKSITAARSLAWSGSRDPDNTPLFILGTDYRSKSRQISEELQALVERDALHGVIGLYFFKENSADRSKVLFNNPGTSYDVQRAWPDTRAIAGFMEWTYDITPKFSVTGGIRYTEEKKGLHGVMFNVAPVTAPEPVPPSTLCPFAGPAMSQTGCLFIATNRFERTFSATTGSTSVQYRWSDEVATYFSWSQGFKSGGLNQRYNTAAPGNAPISFNAEDATTYEFGIKTNPMPEMRLNAALFWTTYDDIQLTYRLGIAPLLFNAGADTIKGGELEIEYLPLADLSFDGSVGYLENGFDSIHDPPPFGAITPTAVATLRSKLPFTPQWQAHAGAAYVFHLDQQYTLTPRIDLSYTGSQFFDAGNSPEIAQLHPVTVLNGSLAVEDPSKGLRLSLNVENIGDVVYPVAGTSSLSTASGYAEIVYAQPRTFSATLTKRF